VSCCTFHVMKCQAKLLEVFFASGSTCRFTRGLNARQQKRDPDDEQDNHDQNLNDPDSELTFIRFAFHKIRSLNRDLFAVCRPDRDPALSFCREMPDHDPAYISFRRPTATFRVEKNGKSRKQENCKVYGSPKMGTGSVDD